MKDPQLTVVHCRSADQQLGHQDRRRARAAGRGGGAGDPVAVLSHGGCRRRLVTTRASEDGPQPGSDGSQSPAGVRECLLAHGRATKWISGVASGGRTRRPARSCSPPRPRNRRCARRWWPRSPPPTSACWSSTTNWKSPQRTYVVRTNSLTLTRARQEGGVASMQDVYQAQILVSTAEAAIADTHRRIEQQENELNILLGRNPGDLQRGAALAGPDRPRRQSRPGLPSDSARTTAGHPRWRNSSSWPPMPTSARPRPPSSRKLTLTGFLRVPVRGAFRPVHRRGQDLAVRPGGDAAVVHRRARCAAT